MSSAKRILLLHAYSSANRGDGLLVDASVSMIREVHGADVSIELVTSYPESFAYLGLRTYQSKPTVAGYSASYLRLLVTGFKGYDLVVGVGGGYLRFGTLKESVKTLIVMGPQLVAAAFSKSAAVYLPQSIGPARFGTRTVLRSLLSRIDCVWVRDNRSLHELSVESVHRASDLALLSMDRLALEFGAHDVPVVSVREHRGGVPPLARRLAKNLSVFDGFVQSAVAGNDDTAAVMSINPRFVCSARELMEEPQNARVVVAVRLHAALMAISAGHYVVHLSYERKGFGAFEDLGLAGYVFNVHDFSVGDVENLVTQLLREPGARKDYDSKIASAMQAIRTSKADVLASLAVREPLMEG